MSLLQCDQCEETLIEPIFIPCGHSICKRHIDESTSHKNPCQFCNQVHQESFVVNKKVARLLDILNRTKANLNQLSDKSKAYERLKQNPADFVNARFDELKRRVEQERDKIVGFVKSQVDLERKKLVDEIEDLRKRCLNKLELKPPSNAYFFNDVSDVNGKLADINEFLVSQKISEDLWEEIYEQTNCMCEQVKAKIGDLEESFMDRVVYRFEPAFDYSKRIAFGRMVVERDREQIEPVSSASNS